MARRATVANASGSERVSALSHPAMITTPPASMSACVMVVVHSVVKLPSSHSTATTAVRRFGHMAVASGALERVSGAAGSPAAPGHSTMKNGAGSDQFAPVIVRVTSPSSGGTLAGSRVMEGRWPSAAAGDAHSMLTSATTPASTSSLLIFIVRLSRYDTPTASDHSACEVPGPKPRLRDLGTKLGISTAQTGVNPHSRSSCLPSLAPVNRRRKVRGMFSNPSCMSTR